MAAGPGDMLRLYTTLTLVLLVLALIALPFVEPGSPSFVVDVVSIAMLTLFLGLLLYIRVRRSS